MHDHDEHTHSHTHSHGHVHENQRAVINRLSRALGHLEKECCLDLLDFVFRAAK